MEITQPPVTPPDVPPPVGSSANYIPLHKSPRRFFRYGIIALVGLALIFMAGAALAEFGLVNTGFDRLYGRTPLAGLWGSLPADPAVALSAFLAHPDRLVLPSNMIAQYNYAAEGSFQTTPTVAATDKVTFDGTLEGNLVSLNHGEQLELGATLRATSSWAEFKHVAVQTKLIKNGERLFIQIPPTAALLTANLPDTKMWLPPENAGKYWVIDLPAINEVLPQNGADLLGMYQLTEEDQTAIKQLLAQTTRRVGIERIAGQVVSHWQTTLNNDTLRAAGSDSLFDLPLDQTAGETAATLDLWIRHGDYFVLKSQLNLSIDGVNLILQFTGQSTASTDVPSDKTIAPPPVDQQIDWLTAATLSEIDSELSATPAPVLSDPNVKLTELTDQQRRDYERYNDLNEVAGDLHWLYEQYGNIPLAESVVKVEDLNNAVPSELATTPHGLTVKNEYTRDPQPPFYYGYRSLDGQRYTLTAVIEDPDFIPCATIGQLCVYTLENDAATTFVSKDASQFINWP